MTIKRLFKKLVKTYDNVLDAIYDETNHFVSSEEILSRPYSSRAKEMKAVCGAYVVQGGRNKANCTLGGVEPVLFKGIVSVTCEECLKSDECGLWLLKGVKYE